MNKEGLQEGFEGSKAEVARFNLESFTFNVYVTKSFYKKRISDHIPNIISELTSNCAEKGAKNITVTLRDNSLRVEDDFVEKEPEKTMDFLNNMLASGESNHTTKEAERKAGGYKSKGSFGGLGVVNFVQASIVASNGTFKYVLTPDNRIVAEAFWE